MSENSLSSAQAWSGSFGARLLAVAATQPDATALVVSDKRLTFGQLAEETRRIAGAMTARGLKPGDHVGLILEDSTTYVALVAAISLIGGVAVLFNTTFAGDRMDELAASLDVKMVFASRKGRTDYVAVLDAAHRKSAARSAASWPTIVVGKAKAGETDLEDLLGASVEIAEQIPVGSTDQPFATIFTSGVTGHPKACEVSFSTIQCKLAGYAANLEMTGASRVWLAVPMYQAGFLTPMAAVLAQGGTIIAAESFDPAEATRLMVREGVTLAYPIYSRYWLPIIYRPNFQPSQLATLSHVALIGPWNVLRHAQRMLPQTVVLNMYGSAETAGAFCLPSPDEPPSLRLAAGGRPLSGHEVRIVDPETGAVQPAGVTGEIQVRGVGVAWEPTGSLAGRRRFSDDGWLFTEDLGLLTRKGRLRYQGRLSEMLNIGGEIVSAEFIETELSGHEDVAFVQVIGRSEEDLDGQVAHAFLELRPGADFEVDDFLAYAQGRLKTDHVPRYITVVREWPVSASKVRKLLLADLPLGERLIP